MKISMNDMENFSGFVCLFLQKRNKGPINHKLKKIILPSEWKQGERVGKGLTSQSIYIF